MPDVTPALPPDSHVHSEWSWDAHAGSMERTCARAVQIGLPALAFTEHLDGSPPALDIPGYLACLERCRERYPSLRILSGVELGEPHWERERAERALREGQFERILASLHSAPIDGRRTGTHFSTRFRTEDPYDVVRDYLVEVAAMVREFAGFEILAHIDFPVRYWPYRLGPFDPDRLREEFQHVLETLADSGRALEINTRVPLDARVVHWWHDCGGQAISFASDAHEPAALATRFLEARHLAESAGFRPAGDPFGLWGRG